uniref:Cyclin-dependent kinases regulatory subunit n=1 Tax=Heterorhabditis bacteriophora TaxID=37862 RepID=A0A1I7WQ95_HETBA
MSWKAELFFLVDFIYIETPIFGVPSTTKMSAEDSISSSSSDDTSSLLSYDSSERIQMHNTDTISVLETIVADRYYVNVHADTLLKQHSSNEKEDRTATPGRNLDTPVTPAIPIRAKILSDRIFSTLDESEITELLESAGWSYNEYLMGYRTVVRFA